MKKILTILTLSSLAACSEDTGQGPFGSFLLGDGPDEFLVLPQKPLELPEDRTQLPEPRPGVPDRVALTPHASAIAALGGSNVTSVPNAAERALIAAFGAADPNIRNLLAQEEAARPRRSLRLLERVFNSGSEFVQYENEIIDADAELARLRALGIATPPAPPTN